MSGHDTLLSLRSQYLEICLEMTIDTALWATRYVIAEICTVCVVSVR